MRRKQCGICGKRLPLGVDENLCVTCTEEVIDSMYPNGMGDDELEPCEVN